MRPTRVVLVVAALVAALVIAGCTTTAADDAVPPPSITVPIGDGSDDGRLDVDTDADAVLVIGDSLTNGARRFGDLGRQLRQAGFDDVTVVAEDGRDITWALEEVEDRSTVAPTVVVEIGTNPSAASAGFADGVVALIDALRARGAERIAWLTPAHGRDDRYEEKAAILSITPGIDLVADWAALVRDDPRRLAADGLHPTEDGYGDLARFMVAAAIDVAG